jgi:hypothetical protein
MEIRMLSMNAAPRDREIHLLATRIVIGLGPIDEPPFHVMGQYDSEHGIWAAEDRPQNGLPSLGIIPLNPLGWYP